jgi:alpha-methylacyl-CoA racemase
VSRRFLAGIRVIDLSQYLPGPFAAQILGDLGAEVVKVEPPGGDPMRHLGETDPDGITPWYKLVNAGKTVIRLDLKDAAGKDAFERLLARADVLVESYRPGTLDRLGFDGARLSAINPRLVHATLSGWGQDGPYRLRAGHDVNYMAVGGGLARSGTAAAPVMADPPAADHASAIQAALAVAAALFARERDGQGAHLDLSLMETVLGWQAAALTLAARGQAAARGMGLLGGGAACYQVYGTADGRFIAVGALEAKFWAAFADALGRPDWIARQHEPLPQAGLIAEVAAVVAARPLADWAEVFRKVDCCVEPVAEPAEIPDHPQVRARGQVRRRDGLVEVLFGLRVDGAPPAGREPVEEATADRLLA